MAALKSNSTKAANEIACNIAHEMNDSRRLFDCIAMTPQHALVKLEEALAHGDWELIALIGLAQTHNQRG